MKEWSTYKLGEIAECSLGKMLDQRKNKGKPRTYLGNVAVRWGSFNIDPTQTMLFEDHELEKYSLKKNDIVICEGGEPGRCAIWKSNDTILIQKALHRVRVNTEIADPLYVYYYISHLAKSHLLEPLFTGSTIKHLPRERLVSIDIRLPDLSTQKQISSILAVIDDKRHTNSLINDNLEKQAQALYKSWFVDFELFKDQGFWESEIGLIPEGWRCTTLSEFLTIKYGKDHKRLSEGIIPVYGSGGLMRYVDTKLHEGEAVLIPRKGSLNNVIYVNEAFWTVDTMFYSIPKQEDSCIYTYLFLANKDLASMNAGSAVPSMTTDILNNMPITAPPAEVLKQFNNICDVYFSRINQNNIENANLSNQRDTLLPKLMSGELKINELDC